MVPSKTLRNCLLTAALFGAAMVFITSPFQPADEPNHLYRIIQLSNLEMFPERDEEGVTGGEVPTDVIATSKKLKGKIRRDESLVFEWKNHPEVFRETVDWNDVAFARFPNTVLYSPVPYVPQVAAVSLGRALDLPFIWIFWMARLFNLVSYLLLAAIAIRVAPIGGELLLLLFVMPMTLFLAATLSADPITVGFAFLFTALVLRIRASEGSVSLAWLALFLVGPLLALAKSAYAVIGGLALLLLFDGERRSARRIVAVALLLVLMAGCAGGWMLAARDHYYPAKTDVALDPPGQLRWVLTHPVDFLKTVISCPAGSRGFVGSLGWHNAHVPYAFVFAWLALLLLVSCLAESLSSERAPLRLIDRAWGTALFAGSYLVTALFIYMSWNSIGSPTLEGLQGRYVIPLAPMVLFAVAIPGRWMSSGLRDKARAAIPRLLVPATIASGIASLVALITRYYIPG